MSIARIGQTALAAASVALLSATAFAAPANAQVVNNESVNATTVAQQQANANQVLPVRYPGWYTK